MTDHSFLYPVKNARIVVKVKARTSIGNLTLADIYSCGFHNSAVLCVVGLAAIAAYSFFDSVSVCESLNAGQLGIIVSSAAFLILGFTMVIPIGGGDMPVIISFLNALSVYAAPPKEGFLSASLADRL